MLPIGFSVPDRNSFENRVATAIRHQAVCCPISGGLSVASRKLGFVELLYNLDDLLFSRVHFDKPDDCGGWIGVICECGSAFRSPLDDHAIGGGVLTFRQNQGLQVTKQIAASIAAGVFIRKAAWIRTEAAQLKTSLSKLLCHHFSEGLRAERVKAERLFLFFTSCDREGKHGEHKGERESFEQSCLRKMYRRQVTLGLQAKQGNAGVIVKAARP